MLPCREVSELISQGLDRHLSCMERLRLRSHRLMCRYCRRYEKQLLLRRAARRFLTTVRVDRGRPVFPGGS